MMGIASLDPSYALCDILRFLQRIACERFP
jgi:hypothetical protein